MSVRSTPSHRTLSFLAITVATAALIACSSGSGGSDTPKSSAPAAAQPADSSPVAVRFGDSVLTADQLRDRLLEQSPFLQERFKENTRNRVSTVKNLLNHDLLAQEAYRRGLDKDPAIQATFEKILVQELIKKVFDSDREVSEEELRAFYDEKINEFVRPDQVRIRHVFISAPASDAAQRREGRRKAQELLAEIRKNEAKSDLRHPEHSDYVRTHFSDVARQHSDDLKTKTLGGDLGLRSKEQLVGIHGEEFANTAFALKDINQVSGLIETPRGFHIAKLVQRQAALNRPFDDPLVRDRFFRHQRSSSYEDFIEDLREKANLRIDEEVLAGIELPTNAPAAIGTPSTPSSVAGTEAN